MWVKNGKDSKDQGQEGSCSYLALKYNWQRAKKTVLVGFKFPCSHEVTKFRRDQKDSSHLSSLDAMMFPIWGTQPFIYCDCITPKLFYSPSLQESLQNTVFAMMTGCPEQIRDPWKEKTYVNN